MIAQKVALITALGIAILVASDLVIRTSSGSGLDQAVALKLNSIADMVKASKADTLTDQDGANLRIAEAKRRNQAHLDFLGAVNSSRNIRYAMAESATHTWMDMFSITYDCDMYDMRRIGVPLPQDGGKWFCDDIKLAVSNQCNAFSLGSNNDYSYETDLHQKFPNCKIDVFDCTIIPHEPGFVSFHKWCLGNQDTLDQGREFKTLATIMNLTKVDRVHIFKIDIEWAEWDTMPQLRHMEPSKLPVVVQIELHLNKGPWDNFDAAFNQVYKFQKLMHDLGYYLVAKERNYMNPTCAEFVYYRP